MMNDNKPLEGLRVLDLSQGIAGPHCGALFCEHGAEVLKVEPPQGDWIRVLGPGFDGWPGNFIHYSRGKKSLCLDMKADGAIDIILDLAATADVVIDNNRPGVSDRLGIGFEALKARNPRVILVSVSGFGLTGPRAQSPLTDTIAQAMSGIMSINRGRADVPAKIDFPIVDAITGLYAFQQATMALWGDPAKRQARQLDISLVQCGASIIGPKMMEYVAEGGMPGKINLPAGSYQAADGWMAITAIREDCWVNTCKALEREDLLDDPRFTTFADRGRHGAELTAALDEIIATRTVAEWLDRLTAHKVLAGPIHDPGDWLADPQTPGNNRAAEIQVTPQTRAPVVSTPGRAPFEAMSPEKGQHSREILSIAGRSAEEIDALIARGAVLAAEAG